MTSRSIPAKVRALVMEAVDRFNRDDFSDTNFQYVARFEGGYVYLDRIEGDVGCDPMCRLRYTGSVEAWEYEVFSYSSRGYRRPYKAVKPRDGSLNTAMRAAYELYPA